MKRSFLRIWVGIGIFLLCYTAHAQPNSAPPAINRLEKMYLRALQGNVRRILSDLDTLSDLNLYPQELKTKQQYLKRFKEQDEIFTYPTKNELLLQLISLYRVYWKEALLQLFPIQTAEKRLLENLENYLLSQAAEQEHKNEIRHNVIAYIKKILMQNGFYVTNGKTAGFYDLLVWAKETETHYNVVLPGGNTDVTVVFMDSVVTMGWEEFATFGKYFPGGWATDKALYCVRSTYDTSSENFKISYLQHEGQHFADYKLYPELSGADLEYRAKLVELAYANQSAYKLLSFFQSNTTQDRSNAHSFANAHVIKNMAKELLRHEQATDNSEWKKLSITDINAAARKLLGVNSESLRKVGKEVKEFIQ